MATSIAGVADKPLARIAPSALEPIILQGLSEDTQFEFAGAARPERKGSEFVSFLPTDGTVKLSWKEGRAQAEGNLFYAGEMRSQISVSPGLMRQVALLDFKVMQGELNRVTLRLIGEGEVTRVQAVVPTRAVDVCVRRRDDHIGDAVYHHV